MRPNPPSSSRVTAGYVAANCSHLDRSRISMLGQEDQFPPLRLSARCRPNQATFAATHGGVVIDDRRPSRMPSCGPSGRRAREFVRLRPRARFSANGQALRIKNGVAETDTPTMAGSGRLRTARAPARAGRDLCRPGGAIGPGLCDLSRAVARRQHAPNWRGGAAGRGPVPRQCHGADA
jgi:hypothetical protein